MDWDLWSSIGLGAGIGLVYGGASYLTFRRALSASNRRFLLFVFGGMILRMFLALGAVFLILVYYPVGETAFVGAFFVVFVVVLALDVYWLHHSRSAASRGKEN